MEAKAKMKNNKKRGKVVASNQTNEQSGKEAEKLTAQLIYSEIEKKKTKQKAKTKARNQNAVLNQEQAKSLQKLLQDDNLSDGEKLSKLREMYVLEARKANSLEQEVKVLETRMIAHDTEFKKVKQRKDRLELLCRELQRQNKTIMEETKKLTSQESEKRMSLQNKFETSIEEVTMKLKQQGEDRIKQMEENQQLRQKLQDYIGKFDEYQSAIKKQMETKDLEVQLKEAEAEQRLEAMKQELGKLSISVSSSSQLQQENKILRENLEEYNTKFNEFHATVTKTNELNQSVKDEMQKLLRARTKLEGENKTLREKIAHLTLTSRDEIMKKDKTLSTQEGQITKLKNLCRSLQKEMKDQDQKIQN